MARLNELEVYQLAQDIGEHVWAIVDRWETFSKWTIGKQLVESADSTSANIAEGYGRYHFKENRQFLFYARGSLAELETWVSKAHKRGLISDLEFKELSSSASQLGRMLNGYIRSIGR